MSKNYSTIMSVLMFFSWMILSAGMLSSCKKTESNPIDSSKKVIIDTDVDSDDAMAILYLINSPGIDVIAITVTGTGFMLPDQGVPIAQKLVALAGNPDLPVCYGANTPLVAFGGFPEGWRTSALDFYNSITLPSLTIPPHNVSSAEMIVKLVKSSPQKVTILGLGPMTNIALALQMDPSIVVNIEKIVMSAGAFAPIPGNIVTIDPQSVIEQTASYKAQAALVEATNSAEYNVLLDAAAFSVILQSGAPVLISPLNASQQAEVTSTVLNPLKEIEKGNAKFIVGVIQPLIEQSVPTYFWDPVAASLITDPSIATHIQKIKVLVELDNDSVYGTTIESAYGNLVDVCFAIDSLAFYNSFIQTIKDAP